MPDVALYDLLAEHKRVFNAIRGCEVACGNYVKDGVECYPGDDVKQRELRELQLKERDLLREYVSLNSALMSKGFNWRAIQADYLGS